MADLYDLELVLDYRTLTEAYSEAGRENAGNNPFFDFYTQGTPRQFPTDSVEFVKLGTVKDPAPLNARGQPARVLQPTGKEKRLLTMINAFDALSLSMDSVQMLRHPEQWALQDKGREEIAQQMEDFATRHRVTKQVFQAKLFEGGAIYLDANGDILESSSGAVVTISTGIPSANLTQIARSGFSGLPGSNDIIDVAWDTVDSEGYGTAKILDQLDELNVACEIQNSQPVTEIWMSAIDSLWIRRNKQIIEHYGTIGGRKELDSSLEGGSLKLGRYTFHFVGGTYKATDGSNKFYIPSGRAVITPKPTDGSWLAHGTGLQLVPNNLNISMGLDQVLTQWEEMYGDFAYILPGHNPPSVGLYMGFNWLLGFRNPASVFAPTVDF